MRRREDNGPNEDDWLAEEDWVEAPTEEMSRPPGRRPRPQPPPGMPSRRLLGLVAAVSIVLLVILVAVLQGGDDSGEEPEAAAPTTTAETATSPGTETTPALQIPESGTLAQGDTGPRVRRLQRALAALGFEVTADGAFGPGTTTAVQSFQEDAGLDADGVVGPATARAINDALAERG